MTSFLKNQNYDFLFKTCNFIGHPGHIEHKHKDVFSTGTRLLII